MNNIKYFLLPIIILSALTAAAQHPRDMKFSPLEFMPPEPIRIETGNGMIVYFLENHDLPVVTGALVFHGGSGYDAIDKAGLASACATLIRSGGAGSRTPEQVDADLDFVGASISSIAGSDMLQMSFRCLRKDIDLVFEILSDMMMKPLFDSSKLALEISNMKDQIRRQNDDPGQLTRRVYYETVFSGHPYGISPTLASVDNIKRTDIIAQHKRYYIPDNCICAVSGDITPDDFRNLIDRYFPGWKNGGAKVEPLPTATMKYTPGVYYAERDINQAHIRFGHLSLDNKNPDRYAVQIMNFALGGGGFTARMLNQVRSSAGLAYSVGTYQYLRPYMGTFFAYCMTRADAMGKAVEMMMNIIDDVRENGITEEELEIARESIINSFVFGYDTPDKIVAAQAGFEFWGFPPDQLEKDLKGYQEVTLEDCKRAAQKYISPENYAIIITGNKEAFDKPLEDFGAVNNVSLEIK